MYVDKQKVKKKLQYIFKTYGVSDVVRNRINKALDVSAADVVEVRHGYWYIVEYEYLNCSECGESYYTGAESTKEARERLANGEYYPYCPYCSAPMDGERKE